MDAVAVTCLLLGFGVGFWLRGRLDAAVDWVSDTFGRLLSYAAAICAVIGVGFLMWLAARALHFS
jgi:hypothetical protein